MKLGIIGHGRLGQLLSRYFKNNFEIEVFDVLDKKKQVEDFGLKWTSLESICKADIIIPIVPISSFENVIKEISPMIKHGIVIDVCSVKEHLTNVMLKYLPPNTPIVSTHPMFGPDSARDTLVGSKMVLHPTRIDPAIYDRIKGYLSSLGLHIIEATPEEHDREIAQTLILTHLIGRTLMDFGARPHQIDTKGHQRLIKILETVENDSFQLFKDMNAYNRFAKTMREDFKKSFENVLAEVSQ